MRTVLIATSMLLLVAACGGKDDKAGAGGPGPAEESLPVTVPAPGAAPPDPGPLERAHEHDGSARTTPPSTSSP